ncbi:MAG: class I SAM-dependent methyltransferase [Deferribacteraceae bacterium]|jgi:SAM-dependent methyltransferase|nr:class I SAM-dependent methyltransferase [Deferribacteraceae bacterium]
MIQPSLADSLKKWDKISRYSQWIYNQYKDFIGASIFDVGIGIGAMTDFYIRNANFVFGVDIFDTQLEMVRQRFRSFNFVAEKMDIEKDDIVGLKSNNFDTIIMVNVLEHIEYDLSTLEKLKDILTDGGRMIIFVPAIPFLFNGFDKASGHYRRYKKKMLKNIAAALGMRVLKCRYFNFFGIFPYFLKGLNTKGNTFSGALNKGDSKLYNLGAILLAPLERVIPPPLGLSCYIIMQKE